MVRDSQEQIHFTNAEIASLAPSRLVSSHQGSVGSAYSKAPHRQQANQTVEPKDKYALINTARTNFPEDLDMSIHMQSDINRDKKDASFIAQSRFVAAPGVTVRLDNGEVLCHRASTGQEDGGSIPTMRELESQQESLRDNIHMAEMTLHTSNQDPSYTRPVFSIEDQQPEALTA